jgi:hypothetical protein
VRKSLTARLVLPLLDTLVRQLLVGVQVMVVTRVMEAASLMGMLACYERLVVVLLRLRLMMEY